jgi:DNA anti-recombination protein RmuC
MDRLEDMIKEIIKEINELKERLNKFDERLNKLEKFVNIIGTGEVRKYHRNWRSS